VLNNAMMRRVYWNKEGDSERGMETIVLREAT
jgi:hypothetical protein